MNLKKLEEMYEISGELRSLNDGSSTVKIEKIELTSDSKRKLADVLQQSSVTRENQSLTLEKLMISEGKKVIEQGQFFGIKKENECIRSSDRENPIHFEARLKALVPSTANPSEEILCEVLLGNIEFDLSQCPTTDLEDDAVLYTNVPMTLYPRDGKAYSYRVIENGIC